MNHIAQSRGWRATLAAQLVAVAVLLGACGTDGVDISVGADAGCQDRGCGVGEVCSANDVCVPEVTQTMSLGLRITPPQDSGLLEEHLTEIEVDGDKRLGDIVLPEPTTVQGAADFRSGQTTAPARIIFRRLDAIAGVPLRRETETDSTGQYALELVPGRYRVTVLPDELPLPPFRIEEVEVPAGSFTYNISPPEPDSYFSVQGTVVRERDSFEDLVPIAGAQVVLQSSTSGATVSTTAETDAEGRFSVTALPLTADYVVRVGPTPMNELVPSLALPPVAIAESSDLGVLVVGQWADPVEVIGAVTGQNAEVNPVPEATVFFARSFDLGEFSHLARANAEGNFAVSLIPGDYEVTVIPPADASYGATSFDETLDEDSVDDPVIPPLAHKPRLSGVVLGAAGEPVSGVLVRVEPTGYSVSSVSLGASTVDTDESGRWELAVHGGSQVVMVQPRPESGLAPRIAELSDVSADFTLNVALEHASTLSGTLRTSDGAPVAGATVDAYLERGDDAMSFASVTTDERGQFIVNLPTLGL